MSNLISLTVVQCTPSSNGGFITKLQNITDDHTVSTDFGAKTAKKQVTYYCKFDTANPVGKVGNIDLDMFEVQERPYTIDDTSSDDHGKTIQCKWLHIKK